MTPEQEEQVRRTLASLPAEAGVPPQLAARLDDTHARLVAEREGGAGRDDRADRPPDELERRRRRRWPRMLVAAASVAVLAYGAGVVLDGLQGSGGDSASTAARDETFAGAGAGAESGGRSGTDSTDSPGSAGGLAGSPQAGGDAAARALTHRTVRLHRETLADDVRQVLDATTQVDGRAPRSEVNRRATADVVAPCATPRLGPRDRYAPARLDGARATLVVRRGTDGTRVAEVYSCDDASRLLASTEFAARR
jgi:hypothetical protein